MPNLCRRKRKTLSFPAYYVRLLFDQNLSPRLKDRLADLYPESLHLRDVGLESANDIVVWVGTPRNVIADLIRNPEGQGRTDNRTRQNNHQYPSPLMETFAKLSGTAIKCLDSQSLKLHFDYGFPPTRE